MSSTKAEHLQHIKDLYRQEGHPWPAAVRDIAGWAIQKGHWKPQRDTLVSQCARELADALREEYFTDPQGRRVRTNHCFTVTQGTLWTDIRTASSKEMIQAFGQRRKGILGDCHQLKMDVDSYNDNNQEGAVIQMIFDFTPDLAEMEQPAKSAVGA